MYHRQAVHFLAKQDYPSALAAVERARMIALSSLDQVHIEIYNIYDTISIISTLDQEDTQHFVAIVATQALCLLKMGDFLTSQMFAEQECELSTDYLDSRLSRSSKTWCNNYLLSRRFMSQCRCC